ncbi:hypothetical protein [Ancylobacter defluvii]|uniref:Uncharacterized protein n=1 Tax=Ancylobacter defluvii TaxID=1282440 RepID=A0A9W6JZ68_9HYPH|nr:hypothetical protein [Ancylobacter defluvii]MBS7589571.1 hypothetical protein [Ancylobacter defluvii]GLK85188.1 hypothetical protein GCM10017653_32580 [Ancylobacter defluvii]
MLRLALFALMALTLITAARAQPAASDTPPSPPPAVGTAPHFTMQPVEGGVLRLDTRSGTMSFCASRSGVWRCEAMPDERAALEAEITRLRDRLAAAGGGAGVPDIAGPPRAPSPDPAPNAAPPAPPDDAQRRFDGAMDEAMRKAEAMFRRFYEMMERLRSDPPQGDKL